jgi:hypothetical protein
VIIDGTTGQVTRTLEPSEGAGGTAVLDAHGDLVLRPGRMGLTVWDRATGESLIVGLDLFRGVVAGRFDPTGRLELSGMAIGLLDIPIDARPVEDIVRDIECRVPLHVTGSRLEPATPRCLQSP